MLLFTFPAVHSEKILTGFPSPNRKDIVVTKDVPLLFAPPTSVEACVMPLSSHCQWDSVGLPTPSQVIGKDAGCFMVEESLLQVCTVFDPAKSPCTAYTSMVSDDILGGLCGPLMAAAAAAVVELILHCHVLILATSFMSTLNSSSVT